GRAPARGRSAGEPAGPPAGAELLLLGGKVARRLLVAPRRLRHGEKGEVDATAARGAELSGRGPAAVLARRLLVSAPLRPERHRADADDRATAGERRQDVTQSLGAGD